MGIIYKTINLTNGKFYVGQQSTNDETYLGSGKILKRAIKKYGIDCFKKEIIEECSTREELNKREVYWIKKLNPEYNLHEGGYGGYNEFAVKQNRKRRGKTWEQIYSPEGLEKMKNIDWNDKNNPFYGKTHTDENKKLNAEQARKFHTGRKRSEETKQKISMAQKGKVVTQEVREKISKSVSKVNKELWKDPEYREKTMRGRRKYYEQNPKVKKEDLIKLLESNKSVTEIIYELGVSIPTYYKYKKQYGV